MIETQTGTKEYFIQILMNGSGIERKAEGFAALYKAIEPFKGQMFAELALKYGPRQCSIHGCSTSFDQESIDPSLTLEAQISTGIICEPVYDVGTKTLRVSDQNQKWSYDETELKIEDITSGFDQIKAEHFYKPSSQEGGAMLWNGYLPISFMKHVGGRDHLMILVENRKGTSADARAMIIGNHPVLAAFGLEGVEGIRDSQSLYEAFRSRQASGSNVADKVGNAQIEGQERQEDMQKYYLNGPLADVVQNFFKETIFRWFEIEKPLSYGNEFY